MNMTDRLIREGDPPAGQLACPKPQYKKPAADEYGPVEGAHGAPFAILKDTEGIPVNPASSGDITALKTELTLVKAELSAIKTNQTSGDQKVQLNGRSAEPTVRQLSIPELTASGGAYGGDPVQSLTDPPGIYALGYQIYSTCPLEFEWASLDVEGHSTSMLKLVIQDSRVTTIPPFRPIGTRYAVIVRNRGASACTPIVRELRYHTCFMQPQNLRAVMAYDLQIRDTSPHAAATDPNNIFALNRQILGGGKVPIYVDNGLDQAVTASVSLVIMGLYSGILGTKEIPASSRTVITNADFPGIDVPSEAISITFTCSVAPTSGSVRAHIDTLVGGSA